MSEGGGIKPYVTFDDALAGDFASLHPDFCRAMDEFRVSDALEVVWQRIRRLNAFVEEQAPWQLAKDDARAADLDRVLASLIEGVRTVAVFLVPYLPERMGTLLDALGVEDRTLRSFGDGAPVQAVGDLDALFPRFERPAA